MHRAPRDPWRVAVRCMYGFPQVIASPSVLDDGTRFPTTFWLTCPHLSDWASKLESSGEAKRWADELERGGENAEAILAAAAHFSALRAEESGGIDACADVSIAGQKDPLATKCLHAHTALALVGVADPIGRCVLDVAGAVCQNMRCVELIDSQE